MYKHTSKRFTQVDGVRTRKRYLPSFSSNCASGFCHFSPSLSVAFHSRLLLFYTYSIWYSHLLTANSYAGNNNERNLITTLKWPASFRMHLREYKYQLLLLTFRKFSLFIISGTAIYTTRRVTYYNIMVNNQL